jgi:formylglycine-generating enzyme required for sulfatase activity
MLAPNTLLQGRYRIIRPIGEGGMGAVYLAEDERLYNEVALKEMFVAGGNAELREQFHREARLLSKLRHPSLPRVIDHFIDGNGQFLVMDYIVGKDLEELLQGNGGPFPVNRVLDWADQLLDVLAYLHTQDEPVIHRDIKPANVKQTPQGRVILLDFGLAKGSSASLQMSFRAATPAYAPLEQMMYQGTDARSDLYSLAVMLYYLMTGQLPPIALQRREAVWRGLPDPLIPANKLNPQVPAGIADVLTQAMSLSADDRPASASEMGESLCRDEAPTIPINPPLPLRTFEFDLVTVDIRGQVKERRKGRAQYYVEDLGGGVTLEMVEIPGGAFLMGSPESEAGRLESEGPQHEITVSPFYMGKYEVTQAQWRIVAKLPKAGLDLASEPSRFKGDNLPVEQVSWEEAVEFCERLSRATGRQYRLPSEAEWEYACRAGTTTPFAFGETITPELVNYDVNYPYASVPKGTYRFYRGQTTSVGSLGAANAFGLYDMHGNVWEWCMDWYSKNYYSQSPNADPKGPNTGSSRVMRGGGWDDRGAQYCRSAYRSRYAPGDRGYFLGFRLVRTLN